TPSAVSDVVLPVQPRDRRSNRPPYTTLFRSDKRQNLSHFAHAYPHSFSRHPCLYNDEGHLQSWQQPLMMNRILIANRYRSKKTRSEEHTSELQSRVDLVCRLLLENKKRP